MTTATNGPTGHWSIDNGKGRHVVALIVLNGASSAGKTSIATVLQRRLGERCLVTGFDAVMDEHRHLLHWRRTALLVEAHRRAEQHVRQGGHAVVDTTLLTRRAVRDATRRLRPLGALLVGVKPPLETSEQWEALRGHRPAGHARRHYDLVHRLVRYDLVVDTSRLTPEEAAAVVLRHCEGR